MFRDRRHRAAVCVALAVRANRKTMWSLKGPRPEAIGRTSPEQREPGATTLMAICWAIWEGTETPSFKDVLKLPSPHLEAVGRLLVAMSKDDESVDRWLADEEPVGPPDPGVEATTEGEGMQASD